MALLTVIGRAGGPGGPRVVQPGLPHVLIVDRQLLFGSGVGRLLSEQGVEAAYQVVTRLEDAGPPPAAVVIHDLPRRPNGWRKVLADATRFQPDAAVILLAGAAGLMTRNCSPEGLAAGVRAVLDGNRVLEEAALGGAGVEPSRAVQRAVERLLARPAP